MNPKAKMRYGQEREAPLQMLIYERKIPPLHLLPCHPFRPSPQLQNSTASSRLWTQWVHSAALAA